MVSTVTPILAAVVVKRRVEDCACARLVVEVRRMLDRKDMSVRMVAFDF